MVDGWWLMVDGDSNRVGGWKVGIDKNEWMNKWMKMDDDDWNESKSGIVDKG